MALQHLRSGTANKRPIPTVMSAGQIAINTNEASPGLFFKDSNGDLVKVGPVHIGTSAPNSSPDSVAATALVTGTVYQILTVGTSDFTLVGASANTVGVIFTATGTTTGDGTVSGQQGVEKGEMWLDTTGGNYVLKIYDGTAWRSEAGEFVNVTGDTMTGDLVFNNADIVFEGATADDFETTLTVIDPTADRTITLPDTTGTVVTTGDTGTVTSTMITDGTIVDADINASAEIAVSKLADGAARQLLQTDAAGTGVEWASNIDIPGTLDVTSAATFDSTVTATGLITANGKVSFPAGTAAAPGLYSGTDIDTGIYAPAANEFGVATAGTSRLVIDSAGNVGIGTTSPSQRLEVAGSVGNIQLASSGAEITFTRSGPSAITASDASGSLLFQTGGINERARIDSSGNVGINNSSPGSYASDARNLVVGSGSGNNGLTIASGSSSFGTIYFADGTSGASLYTGTITYSHSANYMAFWANENERMRIDSSGNVGVGTSSPNNKFTVQDGNILVRSEVTTGSNNLYHIGFSATAAGGIAATIGSAREAANEASALTFNNWNGTAFGERMRLDSSGRLLLNSGSDVRMELGTNGTSGTNDRNHLRGDGDNMKYNCCADGGHIFETNGTERMRILPTGGLTFNGDTAAANALDDYEEGTFTPNLVLITGSTIHQTIAPLNTSYKGRYTKIGNRVWVNFYVRYNLSTITATSWSQALVELPFTQGSFGGQQYAAGSIGYLAQFLALPTSADSNHYFPGVYVGSNTNYLYPTVNQMNGSEAYLTQTYLTRNASAGFMANAHYSVESF
jgi:hypothetical protein